MPQLILIRHGQSQWNLENRFTGWWDVDVTEKGVAEAVAAGELMKAKGIAPDTCFTSVQSRAIKTLNLALEAMGRLWLPVTKDWRLNERHYGGLTGLDKAETAAKHGEAQVKIWRRSYDVPPAPMALDDPRHARFEAKYAGLDPNDIPSTESLKETVIRLKPYWEQDILPALLQYGEVLVSAHGNSLRAAVKILKDISEQDIVEFNIPTGIPYVFEFDDDLHLIRDFFIGDQEEIRKKMEMVANQGKK